MLQLFELFIKLIYEVYCLGIMMGFSLLEVRGCQSTFFIFVFFYERYLLTKQNLQTIKIEKSSSLNELLMYT